MTAAKRAAPALATALAAMLVAGCGHAASAASVTATAAAPAPPALPSLNLTLATASGTWAVVLMGGSAAHYNDFWQMFGRPAASARWTLVTPPGTADNGGLVMAPGGSRPLITAFRPSHDLTFTPLIQTGDGGATWASLNPLDARLAAVPDALAANPGNGSLVALLAGGDVAQAAPGYTSWNTLTSRAALAGTAAGRQCGLSALTATTVTQAGAVLLGGACTQRGVAGIFADSGRTWQLAGPALPPALAGQAVTVLRLTQTAHGTAALLLAGGELIAAWCVAGGAQWTTSPPLNPGTAVLSSASFGSDGTVAVVLTGNRGEITGEDEPGWRALPPLPGGTAALAAQGSAAHAFAVHQSKLTIWQLTGGSWASAQTINVPIQYGSST